MHKRLKEDDFIVDDDGQGYLDTGAEIWDEPQYFSETEEPGSQEMKENVKKEKDKAPKSKISLSNWASHSAKINELAKEEIQKNDSAFDSLLSSLDGEMDVNPIKKVEKKFPNISSIPKKEIDESIFFTAPPLDDIEEEEPDNTAEIAMAEEVAAPAEPVKASNVSVKSIEKKGKSNVEIKMSFEPKAEPICSTSASFPSIESIPETNSAANLPLFSGSQNSEEFMEEDKVLFYWFDAFEKKDGAVLLFGKVSKFLILDET